MGDIEDKPYEHFNRLGIPEVNGPLEGGACVWLIKREEEKVSILFQKRSMNVQNGGFYDASAGGHIDEGEDPLTAALRETREEIGLDLSPDELKFVCTYATDKKYISVYIADRTGKEDTLTLNEDEVDLVEWITLEEFDMFVRARVKPPLRELVPHLPVLRYYIENYL
ncbi:NUDIX domain-containing protein [Candidatus Saccharibacteria bacterium]|nr:NUDIX domain-containing protein [Candidatus Saccharibacteria bacterium]